MSTVVWQQIAADGFDLFGNYQGGYDLGSSQGGYETVSNLLNFAAQVAPTLGMAGAAFGIGLNGAATTNNTISALDKWRNGNLEPSDILQITGSILGGLAAASVVMGTSVPIGVAATIAVIGLAAGPFAKDAVNEAVRSLYDWSGSQHQPSIAVRQYSLSGSEFFTYQLVDKFGFTYEETAHIGGTLADSFTLLSPTVTVTATMSGDILTADLPITNGQYVLDLTNATRINDASTTLSENQFSTILNNLQNSTFGSDQNTVDFTESLLGSASVTSLPYMLDGSICDIYQESVGYFKYTDYGNLIDPGDYWDSFDQAGFFSSCSLDFSDADYWLQDGLWNYTTEAWYLFEKTTSLLGDSTQISENYVGYVGNNARWGSPIAIDLDGDGLETTRLRDSAVRFDLTGDGQAERTGWLSADDAFLAFDGNNNGSIDGIDELFGGLERGQGYAKLATFDSNDDSVINSKDQDFGKLLLWQDLNQDGVSDEGELKTLYSVGLSELYVDYRIVNRLKNGNLIGEESEAVLNGMHVEMADIYFRYEADSTMGSSARAKELQQVESLISAISSIVTDSTSDAYTPPSQFEREFPIAAASF